MTHVSTIPEIGKYIRAGGVNTNYHEAGSGSPVVLIYGSGPGASAWANWRFALPSLAEHLHVFAYDQIGFGQTELPQHGAYSLELWTTPLLDFLRAVDIQRVHFVGNSMGGAVALALAVMHPEMVDRLVLMGSAGVRFPITEGLNAVWGYEPGVAAMKHLIGVFTYILATLRKKRGWRVAMVMIGDILLLMRHRRMYIIAQRGLRSPVA